MKNTLKASFFAFLATATLLTSCNNPVPSTNSTSSVTNPTTEKGTSVFPDTSKDTSSVVTPVVSSVSLVADKISVEPGAEVHFTATVAGENLTDAQKGVTFAIEEGADAVEGGSISKEGVLKVKGDAGETTIKVKATSVLDASKVGEAEVKVTLPASVKFDNAIKKIEATGKTVNPSSYSYRNTTTLSSGNVTGEQTTVTITPNSVKKALVRNGGKTKETQYAALFSDVYYDVDISNPGFGSRYKIVASDSDGSTTLLKSEAQTKLDEKIKENVLSSALTKYNGGNVLYYFNQFIDEKSTSKPVFDKSKFVETIHEDKSYSYVFEGYQETESSFNSAYKFEFDFDATDRFTSLSVQIDKAKAGSSTWDSTNHKPIGKSFSTNVVSVSDIDYSKVESEATPSEVNGKAVTDYFASTATASDFTVVSEGKTQLEVEDTLDLQATEEFRSKYIDENTFSILASSDTAIVGKDESGEWKALKVGKATLTIGNAFVPSIAKIEVEVHEKTQQVVSENDVSWFQTSNPEITVTPGSSSKVELTAMNESGEKIYPTDYSEAFISSLKVGGFDQNTGAYSESIKIDGVSFSIEKGTSESDPSHVALFVVVTATSEAQVTSTSTQFALFKDEYQTNLFNFSVLVGTTKETTESDIFGFTIPNYTLTIAPGTTVSTELTLMNSDWEPLTPTPSDFSDAYVKSLTIKPLSLDMSTVDETAALAGLTLKIEKKISEADSTKQGLFLTATATADAKEAQSAYGIFIGEANEPSSFLVIISSSTGE